MKCSVYEKCQQCNGCLVKEDGLDSNIDECGKCLLPACSCKEMREDEDGVH